MSVHLATEPEELERVFHAPGVREPMRIDPQRWSGAMALSRGIRAWCWEGGCFIVHDKDVHRAEVHVGVLPAYRGRQAIRAAREAMMKEWERDPRMVLFGRTPTRIPRALHFALACGFRYIGEWEDEWYTEAKYDG